MNPELTAGCGAGMGWHKSIVVGRGGLQAKSVRGGVVKIHKTCGAGGLWAHIQTAGWAVGQIRLLQGGGGGRGKFPARVGFQY